MNETQKALLILLQLDMVGFARYENGIFSFKPKDADWQKLVEMNLIDRNGNFKGQGKYYQPVADAKKLSHENLNFALESYLVEMTTRHLNGTITPAHSCLEALNQFTDSYNSRVAEIQFISEEPSEFKDALEVQEPVEVEVKVKRGRKKSA